MSRNALKWSPTYRYLLPHTLFIDDWPRLQIRLLSLLFDNEGTTPANSASLNPSAAHDHDHSYSIIQPVLPQQ